MDKIVETGLSIIFGIFILNMVSSMFLGIDFVEIISNWIRKHCGGEND